MYCYSPHLSHCSLFIFSLQLLLYLENTNSLCWLSAICFYIWVQKAFVKDTSFKYTCTANLQKQRQTNNSATFKFSDKLILSLPCSWVLLFRVSEITVNFIVLKKLCWHSLFSFKSSSNLEKPPCINNIPDLLCPNDTSVFAKNTDKSSLV